METLKVNVDGEEYKIEQDPQHRGILYVYHKSGFHKLIRNSKTGKWNIHYKKPLADPIDLNSITRLIEENFSILD